MTATAAKSPQRRGACPGLSAPLPTGDGLLVRLTPLGTMPLAAFAALATAAQNYGNGIVEVTTRGNIQVRGLSAASAAPFAAEIATLDIAAADGVPILSSPLAGLDREEIIDAGMLAGEIREALTSAALAPRLNPKVSVVIDGGGAFNLDAIVADVRLDAVVANGSALRVGVAGDAATATELGFIRPSEGAAVVMSLLTVVAQRGRDVRARDVVASEGAEPFEAVLASHIFRSFPRRRESSIGSRPWPGRAGGDAVIGTHPLRDGAFASGVGLAFGHAEAASLQRLSDAAAAAGAIGIRTAPDRTLLIIGLQLQALREFTAAAEALGFVVRADDPRRRVIACAGAPICASAHIAARALAPDIAAAMTAHHDNSFRIHVSGCSKGCAHPTPAELTVVGTAAGCELIANGCARDIPFMTATIDELVAAVAAWARDLEREVGHV
jgi:precorrin-3B synthase